MNQFDEAESFFIRSLVLAKEHNYIHEEAIASELAAIFYYNRGLNIKSCSLYKHSVACFKKWGASAVASRVERDMSKIFSPDLIKQVSFDDDFLTRTFASTNQVTSKKRQGGST